MDDPADTAQSARNEVPAAMAAARWLGRFITESPAITIGEAGLAAAAIQELAGRDSRLAAETLRQLAATHDHATVVKVLERHPR